jgi:hypothetical protein
MPAAVASVRPRSRRGPPLVGWPTTTRAGAALANGGTWPGPQQRTQASAAVCPGHGLGHDLNRRLPGHEASHFQRLRASSPCLHGILDHGRSRVPSMPAPSPVEWVGLHRSLVSAISPPAIPHGPRLPGRNPHCALTSSATGAAAAEPTHGSRSEWLTYGGVCGR